MEIPPTFHDNRMTKKAAFAASTEAFHSTSRYLKVKFGISAFTGLMVGHLVVWGWNTSNKNDGERSENGVKGVGVDDYTGSV